MQKNIHPIDPMKHNYNIQSILVIYNSDKPNAPEAVENICRFAKTRGILTTVQTHVAVDKNEEVHLFKLEQHVKQSDALIVLGGDGTLLGIARKIAQHPKPILGINLGTFGFLTTSNINEMDHALEQLFSGHFRITERFLLEAWVLRHTSNGMKEMFRSYALNEALITLSQPGRLLKLWLEENGQPSLAYRCDGLIVATPTGSTGHSLSAGGPILEPQLPALLVTPVSPHSLFNRPWVIGGERELCIRFEEETEQKVLILDGQVQMTLEPQDCVYICRSELTVPTVTFSEQTFINVLRRKFNLGSQ